MQFDRRGTWIGDGKARWVRKTVNWLLMKLMKVSVSALVAVGFVASVIPRSRAQQRPAPNKELIAARHATEDALAEIAIIDRKLMVPMRDGKRMATDVYRPKDTSKKYPIIFVRTPYNFCLLYTSPSPRD